MNYNIKEKNNATTTTATVKIQENKPCKRKQTRDTKTTGVCEKKAKMAYKHQQGQHMQPDTDELHESEHVENLNSFVGTGRTGRRNAVADASIDPNRNLTTSNLSEMFVKIDCKDKDDASNRK
jgi:hypothetical protein